MAVELKPISVIEARLGIEPNGPVQKFFTNTCAKHMDPFVPADKETLAKTVWVDGQPGPGVGIDTITYEQPYARYVYYGISKSGKPLNYSKDKHELANSYWDRRMISAKMQDIIEEVQDYVDRGAR